MLAAFIAFQWLLALSRTRRWHRSAKTLYVWHQFAGGLAPVFFFLHSTRLGFGYLAALALVFFANQLLALLQPAAFPRLKSWAAPWLATHVALSILLVALGSYHAWTALYFE